MQEMRSASESIRSFLISEVRRFVGSAQHLSGVRRIALIGSLTTAKQNPKDADLLIWVDDAIDLVPLAAAARQLKGRAQSRNKSADIFLANSRGAYIGRVCHYRDCRPGIRMSCDARNCGRRPHLCDDLHVLNLSAPVIAAPPLELWPAIIRRGPLPDDIEALALSMTKSK
jgi:hypothetical protein